MSILILLLIIVLWFYISIRFRAIWRSIVYNYVLQNNKTKWLGRLWERLPYKKFQIDGNDRITGVLGWELTPIPDHVEIIKTKGFIHYRKVYAPLFWLAVIFYGINDDDANEDTTDRGYIERTIATKPKWYKVCDIALRRFLEPVDTSFGNAFTLGDIRADHAYFQWANWLIWFCRNPFMNFKYLFHLRGY